MLNFGKTNVKNRKKLINSGKHTEIKGLYRMPVDENRGFHRLFRSYSQVIPTMWITCYLAVDRRLIGCGNRKNDGFCPQIWGWGDMSRFEGEKCRRFSVQDVKSADQPDFL